MNYAVTNRRLYLDREERDQMPFLLAYLHFGLFLTSAGIFMRGEDPDFKENPILLLRVLVLGALFGVFILIYVLSRKD